MKRIAVLIAIVLMSLVIVPCALADFAVVPTFDLTTSSNLAGATDAVYTFHIENRDSSTSIGLSMVIPAGYSLNSTHTTNKSRITVMTGNGSIMTVYGGMLFTIMVTTTSTPGHYRGIAFSIIGALSSDIVLAEPTPTAPGKLDVQGVSVKGEMWLDLSTVPGFFINPSTPGDYTWGPSYANSTSGQRVASVSRPGFTQKVTIIGTSVTTQPTTSATASASSRATAVTSQSSTTSAATVQTVVTGSETTASQPPCEACLALTGLLTQTPVIEAIVVIVIVAAAALLVSRRKKKKKAGLPTLR